MSSTRRASSLRSTPKSRHSLLPGVNGNFPNEVQCDLSIITAIGSTTSNPSGFSCNSDSRRFALCSAAAILLYEISPEEEISHRIFRADPSASAGPIPRVKGNQLSSLAALDSPKRRQSSLRSTGINGSPRSPITSLSEDSNANATPIKSKAISRNRIATCLALSPDGLFLAVGEVSL